MNATITEARLTAIASINQADAVSDVTRLAQYNMLNEIPVAIFGIITLVYIVSSILALAH
jgi:hypothetical protein